MEPKSGLIDFKQELISRRFAARILKAFPGTVPPCGVPVPGSALDARGLRLRQAERAVDSAVKGLVDDMERTLRSSRLSLSDRKAIKFKLDEAKELATKLGNQYARRLRGLTPEQAQMLSPDMINLGKRAEAAAKEWGKLQSHLDLLGGKSRVAVFDSLKLPKSSKVKVYFGSSAQSVDMKKLVKQSLDELGYFVGTRVPGEVKVYYDAGGRAWATTRGGGVHLTAFDKKQVWHEMGHVLESKSKRVHQRCVEFLEKRTLGKPLKWLGEGGADYKVGEMFRDGGFIDNYTGKIYKGKKATEVLSTGLEQLYSDPVGFARRDYDHFRFVISVLRCWL